jgi:hypothetical protein
MRGWLFDEPTFRLAEQGLVVGRVREGTRDLCEGIISQAACVEYECYARGGRWNRASCGGRGPTGQPRRELKHDQTEQCQCNGVGGSLPG